MHTQSQKKPLVCLWLWDPSCWTSHSPPDLCTGGTAGQWSQIVGVRKWPSTSRGRGNTEGRAYRFLKWVYLYWFEFAFPVYSSLSLVISLPFPLQLCPPLPHLLPPLPPLLCCAVPVPPLHHQVGLTGLRLCKLCLPDSCVCSCAHACGKLHLHFPVKSWYEVA